MRGVRRAAVQGNRHRRYLEWVRTAARELPKVQLGDALRIVYLMRDEEALFERAAIRWLGRFCLEARDLSLAEVEAAAGALRRVAWHPEEAGDTLAGICRRAGHQLLVPRPRDTGRAMSQVSLELRAIADAAYGALNSGDLDAFVAMATEDVEFTSLVAEAEGTTFRGQDGVRAWWETVRGAFVDVHWELLDVRGSADRGVTHFRIAGTLGGVPVEQTMWQAVKLREGKLSWWASFRTEHEALEAVGLRE